MRRAFILIFACCLLFGFVYPQQRNSSNDKKAMDFKADYPKLIENYSDFKPDEASMIIDNLRIKVRESQNGKGVIIVYCGKICRNGEIEAHLKGILFSLKGKGSSFDEISVIFGGFREKTQVDFWLVPENANFPVPTSTVKLDEVTFKGKFKNKIVHYECCYG